MRHTHTKIIALISCLIFAFAGGLAILHFAESSQTELLVNDLTNSKRQSLSTVMRLHGRLLENLAYDYSYWDDMVAFVSSRDSVWASVNIESTMPTYGADIAWVFDEKLRLVYAFSYDDPDTPPMATFDPSAVSLPAAKFFSHFFTTSEAGILEVRGAPIQPSIDNERTTPPRGYFFVAQVLDQTILNEIGLNTQSRLSIRKLDETEADLCTLEPDCICFEDTLYSARGEPIAYIDVQTNVPILGEWTDYTAKRNYFVYIFLLVFFAVLGFSMRDWLALPLRWISTALETESSEPLVELEKKNTDLGNIARMVRQFFGQRKQLEHEVLDREMTEETLREAKAKVDALLQEQQIALANTREFIYRHDHKGFMHFVTESILPITGYSETEWKRHYTEFLTDNPLNKLVIDNTDGAIRDGIPRPPYLVEVRHKDGHPVLLEVNERPYFENGVVAGIVGLARDVTQRIQEEKERERMQVRLDKAQRMESIALLAGGVAHDLNNMLGPLVGYPDLILESLPENSPGREELRAMGQAARQAAGLVRDLLTLARRGRYEMTVVDLNTVVANFSESLAFRSWLSGNAAVKLDLQLNSEPLMIVGSEVHLSNALMNLATNAIDAMPDGGTLTIRTGRKLCKSLDDERIQIEARDYAFVTIEDTGIGIDTDDMKKIFEPYYSRKKMGRSGSGLGLAIVYGITKDHRGFYDLQSAPNQGTRFTLLFPAESNSSRSTPTSMAQQAGIETILIVDDEETQRKLAAAALQSRGYTAVQAASESEALKIVETTPVDLVLLDMALGKSGDGLALYRRMLQIKPHQKAVVMSGVAANESVDEALRLGADAFIAKPFTREELARAVRTALDRPFSGAMTPQRTTA